MNGSRTRRVVVDGQHKPDWSDRKSRRHRVLRQRARALGISCGLIVLIGVGMVAVRLWLANNAARDGIELGLGLLSFPLIMFVGMICLTYATPAFWSLSEFRQARHHESIA